MPCPYEGMNFKAPAARLRNWISQTRVSAPQLESRRYTWNLEPISPNSRLETRNSKLAFRHAGAPVKGAATFSLPSPTRNSKLASRLRNIDRCGRNALHYH